MTGEEADLLDPKDGLVCPAGIALDPSAAIYVLETDLVTSSPSVNHRLDGTTLTEDYVTGLSAESLFFVQSGDRLVTGTFAGTLQSSSVSDGVASDLVPQRSIGGAGLSASPEGRVFAFSQTATQIREVDSSTGAVTDFGNPGPVLFSVGFEPDGSMIALDLEQGLITIAP